MKSLIFQNKHDISGRDPSLAKRLFSSVARIPELEGPLRAFRRATIYALTIGSALLPLRCSETTLVGVSSPDTSVGASQDTNNSDSVSSHDTSCFIDVGNSSTKNKDVTGKDSVSSPDILVPIDTIDARDRHVDVPPSIPKPDTADEKADSKGDIVVSVDVFQDDGTMFVPSDTIEKPMDVPAEATLDSVSSPDQCFNGTCEGTDIISSLCDPDGDGLITDKFKDEKFLNALREVLGKGPTEDITVEDANNTTDLGFHYDGLFNNLGGNGISDISGIECFVNLTDLYLYLNNIVDIAPLKYLTNLTDLDLSHNPVSDITPLAGLTNLTRLQLSATKVSNNLAPLKDLINLEHIDIWFNGISDITPFAGLTNLEDLGIGENNISDLTPLAGLTNLTRIDIRWNEISDITPLAGLTNLTELTLQNNKISELAPLENLINLKWLILDKNQISDVTPLADLTNLILLDLKTNLIQDITAIIANPGIGLGDKVCILGNGIPQSQVDALGNKGVDVICMGAW